MRRSRASEARMVGESFELSIASCAQCRRLTCGRTTHHRKPYRPACFSTVIIGTLTALSVPFTPHYRCLLTALSVPLHREPRRPACFSTVLSREHRSTRFTGAVQQWTACMSGSPEDGRRGVSVKCASSAHGKSACAFPLRQCRKPYSSLFRPWRFPLQSAAQSDPATALGAVLQHRRLGHCMQRRRRSAAQSAFAAAWRRCHAAARSWLAAYRSGPVAW
jgi:hypothetical protein